MPKSTTKTKTIKSQAFIALICYLLVGKTVDKISLKALHMLCSRVVEYYSKEHKIKITYTITSLLDFIYTYSGNNLEIKRNNIQIFQSSVDNNDNLIFINDSYSLLQNLSKLFASVPHNEFISLYPLVNDFINMYQLIDFIELNPQKIPD